MTALRLLLLIVGIIALVIGLVWIGQGTGYFPYPKTSFMINQMPWTWRGAVLAVIGVIVAFVSRRI
jgi:membrane protein implicated in regulation of membrane protease activity